MSVFSDNIQHCISVTERIIRTIKDILNYTEVGNSRPLYRQIATDYNDIRSKLDWEPITFNETKDIVNRHIFDAIYKQSWSDDCRTQLMAIQAKCEDFLNEHKPQQHQVEPNVPPMVQHNYNVTGTNVVGNISKSIVDATVTNGFNFDAIKDLIELTKVELQRNTSLPNAATLAERLDSVSKAVAERNESAVKQSIRSVIEGAIGSGLWTNMVNHTPAVLEKISTVLACLIG